MNEETVSHKQQTVAPVKTFVNRSASQTLLIAGVSVPDDPLITAPLCGQSFQRTATNELRD
jgi:hypothetical protein